MTDIPELTRSNWLEQFPARLRKRLVAGQNRSGDDVAALRRFVGLSQSQFCARDGHQRAYASKHWEQGRRKPEGPAIGLLRNRGSSPA